MKQLLFSFLLLLSLAGFAQKTIRTLPMKGSTVLTDTLPVQNGTTQAMTVQSIYNLFGVAGKLNSADTSFIHAQIVQAVAAIAANTTSIGNKTDKATTLTINGTTFDLSANRTWTIAGGGGSTTLNDNLTTSSAGVAALDAHQGLVLKGLVDGNTTAIAARVLIANYIVRETPTGLTNNSNTTFTLSHTPVSGKEEVYVNGIQQEPSSDYTISAATITMILAPRSTDKIRVTYIY